MNLSQAFEQAVKGELTQGDLLKLLTRINETSKEVNATFDAMDKRDAEHVSNSYKFDAELEKRTVASIYADHDKGFTLD